MPIPQLTPFPDPPRIYQPEEEFDAKADEMAGHLPILTTEINALIPQINSVSTDITTKHSDVVIKHDAVMTTAQQMQINATALQNAVNSAATSASAAAAASATAAGRTIYVNSVSGSNSNDGATAAAAVQTLNYALSLVAANRVNTIYLADAQTFTLTASVALPACDLSIVGNTASKPTVTSATHATGFYRLVVSGNLLLYGVILDTPAAATLSSTDKQFFYPSPAGLYKTHICLAYVEFKSYSTSAIVLAFNGAPPISITLYFVTVTAKNAQNCYVVSNTTMQSITLSIFGVSLPSGSKILEGGSTSNIVGTNIVTNYSGSILF